MVVVAYKYVVELLTPTIITSPSGYRGLSYTIASSYIHGSLIRGALFSYLLFEKIMNKHQIDEEALNPRHSVSPALPVSKDMVSQAIPYDNTAFAHSLSYAFKGESGVIYSLGIDRLLELIRKGVKIEEALYTIIRRFSLSTDKRAYGSGDVFSSSSETKRVLGETIAKRDGKWFKESPRVSIYIENAVDRARGSAAEGALYAYEYVEPGTTFVGYISVEEGSEVSKALESIKGSNILVRIGRGIGRGYGISKLTLISATEKQRSIDLNSGSRIVLYMASPVTNPEGLPKPLSPGDVMDMSLWDRHKVARVRIDSVIGGVTHRFYGWSYRTSLPKLPVEALIPGNLAVVSLENVYDRNLVELLHITGFSILSSQGYNFVEFLEHDFIPYLEHDR